MNLEAIFNTILTLVLGAVVSCPAGAVNLSPDGLGQVLLYPYFTVEKGQQTALSIVNTTEFGKAVKVRFLESFNGREVFGLNLYLSPFDAWVGSVVESSLRPSGSSKPPAALQMQDSSCAVPHILNQAGTVADFQSTQYTGVNNDSGPDTPARTREGHIEVIEMGTILPIKYDPAGLASIPNGTFFAIEHAHSGAPAGCGHIDRAWKSGVLQLPVPIPAGLTLPIPLAINQPIFYSSEFREFTIDSRDFAPPSGGLYGTGAIIDTEAGTYINYAAEAIDGFMPRAMHTARGSESPSLNSGNNVSFNIANGELVISHWRADSATGGNAELGSSIDAVSSLLQSKVLVNEFVTDLGSTTGSISEWVVTFPTRRFYVDTRYGAVLATPTSGVLPFRNAFTRRDGSNLVIENRRGFACEFVLVGIRDYEERGPTAGILVFIPIPGGPPQNSVCFNTQVLTINQVGGVTPSSIFGSEQTFHIVASSTPGVITAGWMSLELGRLSSASTATIRSMRASVNGHSWQGLPSIGYWAVRQLNNGQRASGAFSHKRVRKCLVGAAGNCGIE